MKLFLAATLLFSGGSAAAAASNEEVRTEFKTRVTEWVQHRQGERMEDRLTNIRETGLEYPKQDFLDTLTEDQVIQIVALVDSYNAEYNFSELTDDEIKDILGEFKLEMDALFTELGIENPAPTREQMREFAKGKIREHMKERFEERYAAKLEELRTDGLLVPERLASMLDEEQLAVVQAKVDELNAEYDFASMTDDEIKVALEDIRVEFEALHDELGIEKPEFQEGHGGMHHGGRR